MNRSNRLKSLVLPAAIALSISSAFAQGDIGTRVIGAGGVCAANQTMQLTGTLGQPIIGMIHGLEGHNLQGFWHTLKEDIRNTAEAVTGSDPETHLRLQCSPNPASEKAIVRIESTEPDEMSLSLLDQFGREVRALMNRQTGSTAHSLELDMEGLPNGRYTLKLIAGNGNTTLPILVLR